MSDSISSLKNLKKKKPLFNVGEGTAAEAMTKKNMTSAQPNEKKRLSVHLSISLEKEFKTLSKRLGISVADLLNAELKQFLNEPDERSLFNHYVEDEFANRGYNLDATVKQQLDDYCATHNRSKRFVVEAILSDFVKKYKDI